MARCLIEINFFVVKVICEHIRFDWTIEKKRCVPPVYRIAVNAEIFAWDRGSAPGLKFTAYKSHKEKSLSEQETGTFRLM